MLLIIKLEATAEFDHVFYLWNLKITIKPKNFKIYARPVKKSCSLFIV